MAFWLAEQGLDVLSIDFSPLAQAKARALAIEMRVSVTFGIADVHRWNYPEAEFDVVVEIFTQFSSPNERRAKWTGMRQTLKPGGLLSPPPRVHRPSRLNMPRVDRSKSKICIAEKCLRKLSRILMTCELSRKNARFTREDHMPECLVGLTARKPKRPEH